jgi:hypothetical protein
VIANRTKTFLAFLLGAIGTSSSCRTVVLIDDLFTDSAKFQERFIDVRGYVAIDELGHQYLFATLNQAVVRDWARSIDLTPEDGELEIAALRDRACAEVYGKFEAYGAKFVPSGYLLSKAGLIQVKRVSSCPAPAMGSRVRP